MSLSLWQRIPASTGIKRRRSICPAPSGWRSTSRSSTLLVALLLCITGAVARGQERGSAALGELVAGLGVSGRVLVIAAHPDDEDTQLITWLAKGRHVETAYLSLTRGDGGQNLIGNELGEALGAIRTEELLTARRLDGGKQYFTRAFDFGFSKTADETFAHWPHDSVLHDVITVVRAFRPHVIVAVFSGTPRDGHGHHQASGILARQAYDLAGDTVQVPRAATAGLGGWTVQKFYRVARGLFTPAGGGLTPTLQINVGELDPLLGRSYGELADLSRSQHKSQAFGILQRKGVRIDALALEASRVGMPKTGALERTIFDGVDTTWTRFRGDLESAPLRAVLDSLPPAFAEVRARFDAYAPEKLVPALAAVARRLERICPQDATRSACYDHTALPDDAGRAAVVHADLARAVDVARDRINRALALATGVAIEATVNREVWATGSTPRATISVYDRGAQPVNVRAMLASGLGTNVIARGSRAAIAPDSVLSVETDGRVDETSRPWWLATPRSGDMFTPRILGVEESTRPALAFVGVAFDLTGGGYFTVGAPVVFRHADPVRGELNDPIAGAPAITVLLDHEIEYAQANAPVERVIRVHVTSAATEARDAEVTLKVPNGLLVDTATRRVSLPAPGATRTLAFNVRGRLPVGRHRIEAVAVSNGQTYATGYTAVEYDHIRTQRLYRPATLSLEAVDLKIPANLRVAYIAGVGDNVEPTLEQLGVNVTVIDAATLTRTDLSRFSAIVVGTRAYEANPALIANNAVLLDYVKNGGTAVVQYGQYEMQQPGMMPYPITLARPADRVTVETSPVRVTDSTATVLNAPNRISSEDFKGWQQDLTLYMPRTFDPRYASMLEVNDPGEPPNKGAILVAPYGRGTYVYTSLAFFRQLPNGVPGAARLFVNLLAAKAERVAQ